MWSVVTRPRSPEFERLIEQRRLLGHDRFDEEWDGEYHMAPGPSAAHSLVDYRLGAALISVTQRAGLVGSGSFNLGRAGDYRVPDAGLHRAPPEGVYVPTAAMVIEIVSPGDETYEKFGFYAAHDVDELLVAEPAERRVRIWQLAGGAYAETGRSDLLDVTADEITGRIDWP